MNYKFKIGQLVEVIAPWSSINGVSVLIKEIGTSYRTNKGKEKWEYNSYYVTDIFDNLYYFHEKELQKG